MAFNATKQHVANRGVPPNEFLTELVTWALTAPDEIFETNSVSDIYSSVKNVLGPYTGIKHRRAVMMEVLRVLGGFESSWDFNEGPDPGNTNPDPRSKEAGIFQVSADSMAFGPELRRLVSDALGDTDAQTFQIGMKADHMLAFEYTARLLRRTTRHHGPILRHEIHNWLRTDAVDEFLALVSNSTDTDRQDADGGSGISGFNFDIFNPDLEAVDIHLSQSMEAAMRTKERKEEASLS